MTRSDLVEELAARFAQLTHQDAEHAVKAILDAVTEALVRGHRVEIRGFGSFSINHRPPRIGRNPRSGERVEISEKRVPHFKAGKALREAVDKRTAEIEATSQSCAGHRLDFLPGPARSPMKHLMWLLRLLLKAAIFFTLFAFALNNQDDITVNFFFGTYWRGPLVLVVLAAFAAGVVLGATGMAPSWWKHRRSDAGGARDEAHAAAPSAASPEPLPALREPPPAPEPQHGP